MFDLFQEELDGEEFDSIESFNAAVLRTSVALQEELGREERLILTATPEILEDLNVTIKEV